MSDKWWSEGSFVWRITPKGDDVKRVKVSKFRGEWRSLVQARPDLQVGVGRDKIELWMSKEPASVYRTEIDALTALVGNHRKLVERAQVHVSKVQMDLDSALAYLAKRQAVAAEVDEQMRKAQKRSEVQDA